jgi:hypothetical protein
VQRLCAERGLPLVCIQPLVSHIARQQQDYTAHKTGEVGCVLIARLAYELHCYIPEELDEAWAQLRHLDRRRAQLITAATAASASVQRLRDFLSVAWPVAAEACARPPAARAGHDGPVRAVRGRAQVDRGRAAVSVQLREPVRVLPSQLTSSDSRPASCPGRRVRRPPRSPDPRGQASRCPQLAQAKYGL